MNALTSNSSVPMPSYLHRDATSISSSDLFFSGNNNPEHLDRAARAFASKLRGTFSRATHSSGSFPISSTNLNLRSPVATSTPASPTPNRFRACVAAVFEQVDYSKISRDGFSVVVVDSTGGKTCVTKLLARFDPELNKRLPETGGFYWERCPPVIIASTDPENTEGNRLRPHHR